MGKVAKLTTIGITQQLDEEYWNWTNEEKEKMGDISMMMQIISDRLKNGGCVLSEFYAIIHDKDSFTVWDDVALQNIIEVKPSHIHGVIKFVEGATLENLANLIGLEPQYLEKAGKGKFVYDNMLSYLTHIKYTDKHQYDVGEVKTYVGKPYQEVYGERREDWLKGRAKIKTDKVKEDLDYIVEMILTGQITKNQILLTDKYFDVYARGSRRCEDAFSAYGQKRAYKTMQAMLDGEFRLSVIYITGSANAGKSHLANMLCEQMINDSKSLDGRFCLHLQDRPPLLQP